MYGSGKIHQIGQDSNGSAKDVAHEDADHQRLNGMVQPHAAGPDQDGFQQPGEKDGEEGVAGRTARSHDEADGRYGPPAEEVTGDGHAQDHRHAGDQKEHL